MKKTLLVIKTTLELHWLVLLILPISILIASTSYINYSSDKLFHSYSVGLNLLVFFSILLISLLPICTDLILSKNNLTKKVSTTFLDFNREMLFSSLPIKAKDILIGSYIQFYAYSLLFLFFYFKGIDSVGSISLNSISLYMLLGSTLMSIFLWLRYNYLNFSSLISRLKIVLFIASLQLSTTLGISYFDKSFNFVPNSFLTKLITGNSIMFFILSILIILITNVITYKCIEHTPNIKGGS